ncbi:hypothetical protein FZEAL_9 [Fusarium zealandicum]|uniref:Extracellular mutant protein 11 C-terminal domain-containing protein n=1 Tax=Fusarium zealandicum TaxID=1053134 RepID=A0A8H4UVC8_9HYPO|nr:hypothetical protein FZEAL_9 [Fusarium zealandicum]
MQPFTRTNFPIESRTQGHKSVGSAPPSLQPPRNTFGGMAPSLKDKGGRLLAFASGAPKTNGVQSQAVSKPPTTEQPQTFAPAPIRRTAADFREMPGVAGRYTAPPRESHPLSQPPPRSPQLSVSSSPNGRVRTSSGDRRQGLFSGSQLGDHFMESGITTPQNELAEPVKLGPELTRDLKRNIPSHHVPDRNRGPRPSQTNDAFVLGDDLRIDVVSRPAQNHASQMRDGFQDTGMGGRGRPNGHYDDNRARLESPAKLDSKLPMREVRIRKSHAGRSEAYEMPDSARSPSPTIRGIQWQANYKKEDPRRPLVQHLDDEDAESLSQAEEHMTPKPRKAKPFVQPALLESSMPAATVPTTHHRDKKRRRPHPEYDDQALESMPFTALQEQPFDFDPSKEEQKGIGVNADNLPARLDQFRRLSEKEQHDLFSNMSIEDWEASGEWFVDQFANFMQSLTEARRHKRRIVQEFEKEAANREVAVRIKTEAIDRKLCKMKQDGQRVVEDKAV